MVLMADGPYCGCGRAGHVEAIASRTAIVHALRSGLAYGYTRRRMAFPGGAAPENERFVRAVHEAALAV